MGGANLPEGWAAKMVSDCFDQVSTTNNKIKTKEALHTGRFPVVDQGQDFVSGYTNDEEKVIKIETPVIVFGDHTRAVKWVDFDFVPGADGTKVLEAHSYLLPRFSFYQLKALDIPDKGYSRHFKFFKELSFAIPPLSEQKVIAEKLDALLAQVETTKARLERIPEILKRFRQSVLAAAVSGRLTTSSTDKWTEVKIDDIVKIVNGKAFPSSDYQKHGVRLLRPGNLHMSGKVIWNLKNTTFIPESWIKKRPELILREGALLMNLTAQSLADEFLGRVCIFEGSDEATLLNQRICSFESKLNYDIKPYLFVFFRSPQFRAYVDTLDSGTLIKHLNVNDIKTHKILLPDQTEQTEIVGRVEQLFAFADTIEQKANAALERVNNLTQSILAKAFRGEFTADWRAANPELISGENSAEALLERIKAERAGNVGRKRR